MMVTYKNDSIESYQEMLLNLNIKDLEVLQLSNGLYKDKVSVILLPSLRLSLFNKNSSVLLHRGKISENEFVISFNLAGPNHIVNGTHLRYDELNIIGPSEYVYTKAGLSCEILTIGVLKTCLIDYLGEEKVNKLMKALTLIRVGKIGLCKVELIKKNLLAYILNIFLHYETLSHQAIIDAELQIYSMLCKLLEINTEIPTSQELLNNRFKVVQRAVNYIDAKSTINIPIPDIINFSFCSLRSLEYAFKDIFGISPQRYLKIRRMHLIRSELVSRKSGTIQDILTKYGVVNKGRFSKDFYVLFGQYPRDI